MTLIGTVHNDSRSAATLAVLLGQLNPDQITVEICPEALVYRQTHGVLLLRKLGMILETLEQQDPQQSPSPHHHPSVAEIRTLLGLPYEFSVASTHACQQGIKLHAIDQVDVSLVKLRRVEESLISLHHMKKIVSSRRLAPSTTTQSYELARKLLSFSDAEMRSLFLKGCRGIEGIGPRDRHLAAKIRSLLQENPGHLVHIGGWVHLMDDPCGETLYSLLRDLNPRSILLDPDQPLSP